jgi:hypothetical protein
MIFEWGVSKIMPRNCKGKNSQECNKRAVYGFAKGKPLFCVKHKEGGMINVVNPRCPKCGKFATFGYEKRKPLFCAKHREESMIDVIHPHCSKCGK